MNDYAEYGPITIGTPGTEPYRLPEYDSINLKSMTVIGWAQSIQHVFREDGTVETTVWQ